MLIQQNRGGPVHWTQLPVYLAAELLAGVAAAGAFAADTRTPADRPIPDTVAELVPGGLR
jgi:glycerol uptake facilitator protein